MIIFLIIFVPTSTIVALLLFIAEKKEGYVYRQKEKLFNTSWAKCVTAISIIGLLISAMLIPFLENKYICVIVN